MNKTTSLSIVASLALLVIPAETAFASEVNAKDSAQTLRKHVATKQVRISQPGSDRMLNPQPLPPKDKFATFKNYGSDRALNPQPLPPKATVAVMKNYGSDRSLNPQPLPPKETLKLMVR
jgi:hypothetical protein